MKLAFREPSTVTHLELETPAGQQPLAEAIVGPYIEKILDAAEKPDAEETLAVLERIMVDWPPQDAVRMWSALYENPTPDLENRLSAMTWLASRGGSGLACALWPAVDVDTRASIESLQKLEERLGQFDYAALAWSVLHIERDAADLSDRIDAMANAIRLMGPEAALTGWGQLREAANDATLAPRAEAMAHAWEALERAGQKPTLPLAWALSELTPAAVDDVVKVASLANPWVDPAARPLVSRPFNMPEEGPLRLQRDRQAWGECELEITMDGKSWSRIPQEERTWDLADYRGTTVQLRFDTRSDSSRSDSDKIGLCHLDGRPFSEVCGEAVLAGLVAVATEADAPLDHRQASMRYLASQSPAWSHAVLRRLGERSTSVQETLRICSMHRFDTVRGPDPSILQPGPHPELVLEEAEVDINGLRIARREE